MEDCRIQSGCHLERYLDRSPAKMEAADCGMGILQLPILVNPSKFHASHCNLAYSVWACFKTGISGSASFHRVRKSW